MGEDGATELTALAAGAAGAVLGCAPSGARPWVSSPASGTGEVGDGTSVGTGISVGEDAGGIESIISTDSGMCIACFSRGTGGPSS